VDNHQWVFDILLSASLGKLLLNLHHHQLHGITTKVLQVTCTWKP
jgi:hypothetical protein